VQIIRENVPIPTFDIRTRNTFCALQLFLRIDLRNFLTTRKRTRTSAGRIASSMVVPSLNPGEYLVKILWLQYSVTINLCVIIIITQFDEQIILTSHADLVFRITHIRI
jgi:hypothetical protein